MSICKSFAFSVLAIGLAASSVTAEARSARAGSIKAKPAAATDSATSIRANAADPGGDYRGYPDWARAALGSGRGQTGR